MSKSKFTKHINELNIQELKYELIQLYSKLPEVKQHYAMELGSELQRKKIYDKFKKDIASKYATKSFRKPRRPRIQKINTILSKIEKAAIFQHELVDILMYDVESALVFIAKYHFYSTTLGNHIDKTYEKALLIVKREMLQNQFRDRAYDCMQRSKYILDLHHRMKTNYEMYL